MANSAHLSRLRKLGLRTGNHRQKPREDPQDFLDRMVKSLPKVLALTESAMPLVAHLYGVPHNIVDAVIDEYKLGGAKAKGLAIAVAKEKEGRDSAEAMRRDVIKEAKDAEPRDDRLKRQRWPGDPVEREDAQRDGLQVALVERGADLTEISDVLSIPLWDILRLIDKYVELQEARDEGRRVQVALTEGRLIELKNKSTNATPAKMLLAEWGGWAEKQDIHHKHSGFTAPAADDKPVNILELIQGSKKEAG